MDRSDGVVSSVPSPTSQIQQMQKSPPGSEQIKGNKIYIDKHTPNLTRNQSPTDRILHFLSNASNEALIAVLACLAAATYILLGRLGLLLIGLVAGVLLHASWEEINYESHNEGTNGKYPRGKKELGLEVANRLLDWRARKSTNDRASQHATAVEKSSEVDLDYSGFRPATAAALMSLTDAIIKDYVNYWYVPILPSETSFSLSCRRILTGLVISVSSHLSRKRPADTFLEVLTNSSSMIIVFLNELSTALGAAVSNSATPEETVTNYLEQNPESSLANVLAVEQQRKKLNTIADDFLSSFLDAKAYDCEPVRNFLREILAGVVLESTIKACSSPEFINSWIIYLLKEGEPEIMNAIDAGVEGARKDESVTTPLASVEEGILPARSTERLHSDSLPVPNTRTEHVARLEAMEEAVTETRRLSEMIATQDALKKTEQQMTVSENSDSVSNTTTEGASTPTSSDSEKTREPVHGDTYETRLVDKWPQEDDRAALEEGSFTDFDQLIPSKQPTALRTQSMAPPIEHIPPLTLHSASVSIDDGSGPGDKGMIRAKPTADYALQIEPASLRHPGWIIFRKYTDFESLHGALGPISRLNHIYSFADDHPVLPTWKGKTKQSLTQNLEKYLRDALQHEPLAESERMRKFLEKDRGLGPMSAGASKTGFSFPSQSTFESMGKGVLDVLASAPKGVTGGGKAVFGGVTGVFGSVSGANKRSSNPNSGTGRGWPPKDDNTSIPRSSEDLHRTSEGSRRFSSSTVSFESDRGTNEPASSTSHVNETRGSLHRPSPPGLPSGEADVEKEISSHHGVHTLTNHHTDQQKLAATGGEAIVEEERVNSRASTPSTMNCRIGPRTSRHSTIYRRSDDPVPPSSLPMEHDPKNGLPQPATQSNVTGGRARPITDEETRVAVELIFAVINELYTLSSAWNIRRTLLNAAKSYILRPGNPNLEAIRVLLQETMIDAHTSDEALAAHIAKLRENCLPTEEELKAWPPPPDGAEKERLRVTARKLLVQRGVPQALTSVMGAAASGEALGKVFDCLQVGVVARGFIFALLLQALKAATL